MESGQNWSYGRCLKQLDTLEKKIWSVQAKSIDVVSRWYSFIFIIHLKNKSRDTVFRIDVFEAWILKSVLWDLQVSFSNRLCHVHNDLLDLLPQPTTTLGVIYFEIDTFDEQYVEPCIPIYLTNIKRYRSYIQGFISKYFRSNKSSPGLKKARTKNE